MLGWLKKASGILGEEAERMVRRTQNTYHLLKAPYPMGVTPHEIVMQRNKMRLLAFARYSPSTPATARPILIVPSLINRYYILDLQKEKSYVEFLSRQGFPVYVIDWGNPTPEDQYVSFSEHIDSLIHGAVRKLCALHDCEDVHLVGHCVGGMLTLSYAALYPSHVASLLNLTTPIDLSQGGILTQWTRPDWMDPDVVVETFGNAPAALLQASFQFLVPMGKAMRQAWIYEQLPNDEAIENIRAIETWANDNVSLPGDFFRTFIRDLYQKNALYQRTFHLAGRRVDLTTLKQPILNIACKADHIAPPASVFALKDLVPHTQNIQISGGHIAVVASSKSVTHLWPQTSAFFQGCA